MKAHSFTYRRLILLLLLVLPLQSFAAALMPLQMLNASMPLSDTRTYMPCHESAAHADTQKSPKQSCDSCTLCHLCRAFTPLLFRIALPRLSTEQPSAIVISRFVSHIPQQPQRPPRLSLV